MMKKLFLYIKFIRISHWIKNIFVFIPMIFSNNLFSVSSIILSLFTFLGFSLASSIIYVINDINDLPQDRNNILKQDRPLVKGCISKSDITIILLILIFSLLSLTAIIPIMACIMILLYLLLNIAYTYFLKHIVIIDVVCIALGFILRVVCGAFAINVIPSQWLLLVTFMLSSYLGFGKRLRELLLEEGQKRPVIEFYNQQMLNSFINITAVLFLTSYINYTMALTEMWDNSYYLSFLSIVLILLGFFRYHFLIFSKNSSGDPTNILYQDKFLWIYGISYSIAMFFILYI